MNRATFTLLATKIFLIEFYLSLFYTREELIALFGFDPRFFNDAVIKLSCTVTPWIKLLLCRARLYVTSSLEQRRFRWQNGEEITWKNMLWKRKNANIKSTLCSCVQHLFDFVSVYVIISLVRNEKFKVFRLALICIG